MTAAEKNYSETELYKYTQLMDILVQVTHIYDNKGQNWNDDWEDP